MNFDLAERLTFYIPLLLSLASLGALAWHIGITRQVRPYWCPEFTRASLFFALVVLGIVLATNRPLAINYFSATYWKIIVMTFAIAWLARSSADFALSIRLCTLSGLAVGLVRDHALERSLRFGDSLLEEWLFP